MKNGTMFSDLTKYKNKDFYKEHKYVQFDTTKASGTYLVVYAFVSEVNKKSSFEYYNVSNWRNKKRKKRYIKELEKIKLYETGEKITLKDKLLTLSTCENTNKNSRMVIVCKLLQWLLMLTEKKDRETTLSPKPEEKQGDNFVT